MSLLVVFFPAALFMLSVAGLLAMLGIFWGVGWGDWPILHLALVGGVSQLVIGAAQFFVAAFLSTDPPSRPLVLSQAVTWNSGVIALVASRPLGVSRLAEVGAVLLLAGLVLFAAGLAGMRRRSLQSFQWSTRWYAAAAAFLFIGVLAGLSMVSGTVWTYGSMLGAHLVLNLLGWFGTAIVGTLHTLLPSLSGTRLRFPRLEPVTYFSWLAGVAVLAFGLAFDSTPAAILGWSLLLVSACVLTANLAMTLRQSTVPPRLSLRLVASAQLFLPVCFLLAMGSTVEVGLNGPLTGIPGEVLPVLLLAGWIGLTVAGSLLHLVAMMARVRSGFAYSLPKPNRGRDSLVTAAALVGLTALTLAIAIDSHLAVVLSRLLLLGVLLTVAWKLSLMLAAAFNPRRANRQALPAGHVSRSHNRPGRDPG